MENNMNENDIDHNYHPRHLSLKKDNSEMNTVLNVIGRSSVINFQRNNSVSYYSRNKRTKNYHLHNTNSSYKKKKNITFKRKGFKKLIFINSYERCNDFSNYKGFINLNLKFLKQNYKFKDQEIDENLILKRFNWNNQILLMRQQMQKNLMMNNMMQMNVIQNNIYNMDNAQQIYPDENAYKNNNDNMLYYESLRLQPYTFIKDPKIIDENLRNGRYLKGVIRINRCHTHGYITVSGLDNDILIRGNRNLNQSLHMDEVIVELFPMVCWKPLYNKKIRKISITKNEEEAYFTELDKDDEEEVEESGVKYKEDFEDLNDRLIYINKAFNLRPEGRIVKIVNSPNIEKPQIVKIINDKSLIFACPIDENLPRIFIKMKKFRRIEFLKKLENDGIFRNKYFYVKIVGWALNFKCPKGIIVNELGNSGDIEVETEVLLRTYEIDYSDDYPHQAMEDIKTEEFINEEIKNRIDLRDEIIFTIDPLKSKDLDDAISVKMIDENTGLLEIGVHIADPTHFVIQDSLLDKEAINRVTTVYLVHKNIPMLPRSLSENLCSILPNKDRLAISCVFRIFLNGALDTESTPKFFLSAIRSAAKFDYEIVQRIIKNEEIKYDELQYEGRPASEEIYIKIIEKIRILHKLTSLVRSQRIESGSLIIENEEITFTLNEINYPIDFKIKKKLDSNHLIEELMLIANKLSAEFLYDNIKEKAIIRKHPLLNDNKFIEIQRYLSMNKIIVDFEDPQELNDMFIKLEKTNRNKYICVQRKLKNFMQRAEYIIAGENELTELRHSALNFDLYTHFTSPIRRYPDMIVHRQIKHILYKQSIEEIKNYNEYINTFNEKYINGKLIGTKCQKLYYCLYLKNIPVQVYKALVVDISIKNSNKNKRNLQPFPSENILVVSIFIESLNLELEWKKEDNQNVLNHKFNPSDSSLTIDYKMEDNSIGNRTIKTFDEILISVCSIDSIPIDLKCTFIFNY